MNFIDALAINLNIGKTANGALTNRSTLNGVYDMFAFCAAYRQRSDSDCVVLFQKALKEDCGLAMKCLFFARDIREGTGERRFFRVCMKWLANNYPEIARRNMPKIPTYGRFDDLYCLVDTPLESEMLDLICHQLKEDYLSEFPSLCAKWAPSPNASSAETKRLATKTRLHMDWSEKNYRKMLSQIRERLKVLERLMSGKRWDEIDFSKLSSQAGMKYSKCFSHREELKERYSAFMNQKDTKVNAAALYPYECVKKAHEAVQYNWQMSRYTYDEVQRQVANKYWENMPDWVTGNPNASNFLCVCDTSRSMTSGCGSIAPITVAISLALYFAERAKGPFAGKYISFASRPQLIECLGVDFTDKVNRIWKTNLCDNTNLKAVFDLLLDIAKSGQVSAEDFVKNLVIVSDMDIDYADETFRFTSHRNNKNEIMLTLMEEIRIEWELQTDIPFPNLVYWNVNAVNNNILDLGPGVSYVSGASPAILKQILSGKTGWELCYETLVSDRYKEIY